MYVVMTTVLMVIGIITCTNLVLATSSVAALTDNVGRSRGVAERRWHVHTSTIEFMRYLELLQGLIQKLSEFTLLVELNYYE